MKKIIIEEIQKIRNNIEALETKNSNYSKYKEKLNKEETRNSELIFSSIGFSAIYNVLTSNISEQFGNTIGKILLEQTTDLNKETKKLLTISELEEIGDNLILKEIENLQDKNFELEENQEEEIFP